MEHHAKVKQIFFTNKSTYRMNIIRFIIPNFKTSNKNFYYLIFFGENEVL